jgi:hypothetical protein
MKLVIDRNKWLRGEGTENSCLLRPTDGKMCCLGFFGLACGLTAKRITDVVAPVKIPVEIGVSARREWMRNVPEAEALFDDEMGTSEICGELMSTNDRVSLSEAEREQKIRALFAEMSVEVVFV